MFFFVQAEGNQFELCRSAWLLIYGISEGTYKKRKQVLSFEDATQLWKHHHDLDHERIKLIRFKASFSVCKVCVAYELKFKGQLSVAEREEEDRQFFAHITETKKERAQYAKDQVKCSEDGEKLVIIIDSIDKWKTTSPFFVNAPKSATEGTTLVTTKLFAASVHGFGSGLYCFWASDILDHDSNLTIEVIRRTLLKIQDENGTLPRRFAT